MRLFVLAAGKGKRLRLPHEGVPKCLVELGDNSTLLGRLVGTARAVGSIDELIIVAGYGAERVEEAVESMESRACSLRIRVLYNPFYETAGPLVSLWVAHHCMEDMDFLVCNGDTYYSSRALELVAGSNQTRINLGVDHTIQRSGDHMKVELDANGRLRRVGKGIAKENASAVSVGLLAVNGADMRRVFAAAIRMMVRDQENIQTETVWHSILNHLVEHFVPVETVELTRHDWHEIDTVEDLYKLRRLILTAD